jgi:hypothetical protein
MAQLLLCKTQAPTEHRMGWDSIEAVVDRRRGDVRQLSVLSVEGGLPAIDRLN